MKPLIIIFAFFFILTSCENRNPQKENEQISSIKKGIKVKTHPSSNQKVKIHLTKKDTCFNETSSKGFYTKLKLRTPTAITFLKHYNQKKFSLKETPKQRGHRYRTTDGFGNYITFFKPFFEKENINIISSNQLIQDSILITKTDTININPHFFKNQDGVILFTPGKDPIVWQFDFSDNCHPVDLLNFYFKQ